jgi:hypothetical protein
VESFTAWAGFPAGRYGMPQVIDAFGALCKRAAAKGPRCPPIRLSNRHIGSVGCNQGR